MNGKKVLIGMSGGVDSAVAAYLMMRQGFVCEGALMQLYVPETDAAQADTAVADAEAVAGMLGIPFYVFDLRERFRELVMEPFVKAYEQGLTPNPCIACNRHLKFDQFWRLAEEKGCRFIATGHYARICRGSDGRYLLRKAADRGKDQSYFLYTLTQTQLAHTLFPLGELTKEAVRQIAMAQGLVNAKKRDSQDICFVPDGDYLEFMKRHTGKQYAPGDFLDLAGKPVGRHRSAVGYTLGQRKGLGLALGQPVYVCGKDMENNTVTVGADEALYHKTLWADAWNWISVDGLNGPMRVTAKTRSRQTEQPAWVIPRSDGYAEVVFDAPQRAVTPGQAVVLYDEDTVVGGGTIRRSE